MLAIGNYRIAKRNRQSRRNETVTDLLHVELERFDKERVEFSKQYGECGMEYIIKPGHSHKTVVFDVIRAFITKLDEQKIRWYQPHDKLYSPFNNSYRIVVHWGPTSTL